MILHVDMDAFYASIEERDRPELMGKPVIVGGTPEGRGVVAAANYVARQYGIHSAMAAVTARRLCPQAIYLPPRMQYYAEVSKQIHEIFQRFTPIIEPLSLDEAFLDVRGSEQLFGSSAAIGRRIKAEIRQELRLVASVGVAPVKFVAKIASDLQKPDGFVVVDAKRVQEFLDPLPVSRLWGVGRVAGEVFRKLGIHTIGQLRKLPAIVLLDHFMDVIASCGKKVGVADRVEGSAIKLTKKDSPDGQHHYVPVGWIGRVDGHVPLTKNSKETEENWKSDAMSCGCGS